MFSIYGPTGLTFSGSMEQLIAVREVTSVGRAHAIRRIGDDLLHEAAGAMGQEQTAAAYSRMLHQDLERGPLYHASQVMHAPVVVARLGDPVDQVWRLLAERGIRQVPILDATRRLVGLVTDRDLLTALNVEFDQVRDVLGKAAADVMRAPVVAAAPETDIRHVAHVMLDYGQSGVPILDAQERLVGFISRGDILRAVATDPPLSLWV